MFFRDFSFVLRKTSDIITVRWLEENARPHPSALYVVRLLGDEECYLDEESFNEIEESPRSFIAAYPGILLLEYVDSEEGSEELERSPVIAWSISRAGKPHPVTTTGRCPDAFWTVRLPDGTVSGFNGQKYPTEHEYLSKRKNPDV